MGKRNQRFQPDILKFVAIMNVSQAYDVWSSIYDSNTNRTRDMEGAVLRAVLRGSKFGQVLELGCGTGKNTEWLITRAKHVTAVDFSEGMLEQARMKVQASNVRFVQGDLLTPWDFTEGHYDLATFSLVLEHIPSLDPIIQQATAVLRPGGRLYIGELHPFKQYAGSKARFDTAAGRTEVMCFTHHVSEFIEAGLRNGLSLVHLSEHFDDGAENEPPRILSLLFLKA